MTSKHENVRQIKIGAIISYIAIAFNILAGLLYTPFLISKIGQSDYGLYVLCASIIGFFAMDFGIGGAISRFVSKYRAEGNTEKLNNFLGLVIKLFLVIDAIIFISLLVMLIFMEQVYVKLSPQEIEKLKVLYVISGMFSLVSFPFTCLDGILISFEKFIFHKSMGLIQKMLIVSLMVAALIMGKGLYAIVIVNAFVGLIIISLKLVYVKRKIPIKANMGYTDRKILKQTLQFILWSTVIVFAERFILNITPTILGRFSGSTQISIFSIGMTIEGYAATFAQAINGMFMPKVSQMISDKQSHEAFENLMIRVGRIQLFIIGLIISGFISMGREFIHLWTGTAFANSYAVAVFLLLPFLVLLTQDIANTMIMAENKVMYRSVTVILNAMVSLTLSFILTPRYGAIGSAMAIFCGGLVAIVFINIVYSKVLKINIIRFFVQCHLKIVPLLLITTIFGLGIQFLFPTQNMIYFSAKALIMCLFYFIIMWNFALNQSEKNLFTSIFASITRHKKD